MALNRASAPFHREQTHPVTTRRRFDAFAAETVLPLPQGAPSRVAEPGVGELVGMASQEQEGLKAASLLHDRGAAEDAGRYRDGLGIAIPTGVPDAFLEPVDDVARDLVGCTVRHAGTAGRIVEVESYHQEEPACHAYGGPTARNAPLFGPPGHAYVYFTYGMHWCANAVCGRDGGGVAVLLRAAEPVDGVDEMRALRPAARRDRDLLSGPARLCQAFGLDGTWSGHDLCDGGPLYLADDGTRPAVETGPRVGVVAAADHPWRFLVADSPWASAYKRHPRA